MSNLLFRIFKEAYYRIKEYDVDQAIKKAEADLAKLKDRIMNGDMSASKLAWNQLDELDKLKTK